MHVYAGRWGLTTRGEVLKKFALKADHEHCARRVVQPIRRWQGEMGKAGAPQAHDGRYVTVTATSRLNIRQGRRTSFPIAGTLTHGEQVLVGDDSDGWLWLADGRGFIAKAHTAQG